MIPAQEKESAASVFPITLDPESFPVVAFRGMGKPPTTGHLIILPALSKSERYKTLDERDIEKLFASVAKSPEQDTEAIRNFFSKLIKTTLEYRDEMLESRNMVVTVEDVRLALNGLIVSLMTGSTYELDNKISKGLLRLWLNSL